MVEDKTQEARGLVGENLESCAHCPWVCSLLRLLCGDQLVGGKSRTWGATREAVGPFSDWNGSSGGRESRVDSGWNLDLPVDWAWRIEERQVSTTTGRFWPEPGGLLLE